MYRGFNFGFVSSSAAVAAAANPGTDNLVAWLGLDEGSGTSVSDKTSNNNDFTITNGTFVSGKVGSNAVRLDGTGDYISSDSALTIGSKICSIAFWMYWTDSGSGEKYLYELGERWWQTDGSIALKWDQSNARFLAAMQDSTGGTKYLEVAFPEPSDGQWVYVTAVFNGTANSNYGEIKLYYDGTEQSASSVLTNNKNQASDFTSSTLFIGANSTGGEAITIDVDTFAIFSDELTANEITWLYNSGSGRSYSDVSGVTDITLEAYAENEGHTGYSSPFDISVNYPAVSANDILLAIISTERRVDFDGTPPTDWTKVIETDGDNAQNSTQAVYWYRATESASASTNNTWGSIINGSQSYHAWVGAYSGCVTSGSPIDASAGSYQAYDTSWSQSLTTLTNNAMILAVAGSDNESRTFSWSDGTELIDKGYQSTASISINEKIEATAGAATRSGTISSSISGTMTAVALMPPRIKLENQASTNGLAYSGPINIDVAIPAVSANDILLLLCTTNDASAPTDSPPSDWTKIAEQDGTGAGISTVAAYWKRASGSATATTETWSAFYPDSEYYYIWVGAYSGCTTSGSPIDAYGTNAQGYSTSWSVSVTTTVANAMVVSLMGTRSHSRTVTWADGTELIDTAYQSAASAHINEKLEPAAGSKTRSATPSAGESPTSIAVALKP